MNAHRSCVAFLCEGTEEAGSGHYRPRYVTDMGISDDDDDEFEDDLDLDISFEEVTIVSVDCSCCLAKQGNLATRLLNTYTGPFAISFHLFRLQGSRQAFISSGEVPNILRFS